MALNEGALNEYALNEGAEEAAPAVTVTPPPIQHTDRQYMPVAAATLGGVLE